jgi:Ca-activated chloride channel family protein
MEVVFMKSLDLKQILLITDGCSNVGMSPVEAARFAKEEGYTVNVIGIVDQGELGEYGANEIRETAIAGGGMSRIVPTRELPYTVQMMTRQAMTRTIHQAVNQQLRQILAGQTLEQLPPSQRGRIVEAVDEWVEASRLQIGVLVDMSLSMKPKLASVIDAIKDLSLSLQARKGDSSLCVMTFPGDHQMLDVKLGWTQGASTLPSLFQHMKTKGTTPTGPAIMEAVQYMNLPATAILSSGQMRTEEKQGLMEEYVF